MPALNILPSSSTTTTTAPLTISPVLPSSTPVPTPSTSFAAAASSTPMFAEPSCTSSAPSSSSTFSSSSLPSMPSRTSAQPLSQIHSSKPLYFFHSSPRGRPPLRRYHDAEEVEERCRSSHGQDGRGGREGGSGGIVGEEVDRIPRSSCNNSCSSNMSSSCNNSCSSNMSSSCSSGSRSFPEPHGDDSLCSCWSCCSGGGSARGRDRSEWTGWRCSGRGRERLKRAVRRGPQPPKTFVLIVMCNLLGILLGLFGLSGGIYMCAVCLGTVNGGELFNGRQCSLQQKVGGPVGVCVGVFACVLSGGFILNAAVMRRK